MIASIDVNRHRLSGSLRWGIEPICAVLQIAPSMYTTRTFSLTGPVEKGLKDLVELHVGELQND